MSTDGWLRLQREAAERDVLGAGVLLHNLLAGAPALDEKDLQRAIARLAPLGRDLLRLPRQIPHPVADGLRVIVNRAIGAQVRQRYRSARTLASALSGWRDAHEREGGGVLALLQERVASVGLLPALPGVAERAARLALMDKGRTAQMAEVVLQDMALSFEMLRNVNSAQLHGVQVSANGPILTVRRSIQMLGLVGVRKAALTLRAWPGTLREEHVGELRRLMDRVRLAGCMAQFIRPPGFDAEVMFLVTQLQSLGRLLLQYHLPDEAAQVRQLMRPVAPERPGEPEHPGLSEDAAAVSVLGVDIESLGKAVARSMGFTEEVLHLIHRLPTATAVRSLERDDDLVRATASCANEAIDTLDLPQARQTVALDAVAQRYHRTLGTTLKELQDSLHRARNRVRGGREEPEPHSAPAALDEEARVAPLPGREPLAQGLESRGDESLGPAASPQAVEQAPVNR